MRHARVVLSLLVAGCFTDYEVGAPGGSDGSIETETAETDPPEEDGDSTGDVACPASEPGAGTCPARCSGGCALGTCTITCNEATPCPATDLVCPQGWPCVVLCDGRGACPESTVHCSDGPCELQCSGTNSCDGVVMMCGDQACSAWCSEEDAGVDDIECGPSCHCEDDCEPGDSSD